MLADLLVHSAKAAFHVSIVFEPKYPNVKTSAPTQETKIPRLKLPHRPHSFLDQVVLLLFWGLHEIILLVALGCEIDRDRVVRLKIIGLPLFGG